MAVIEFKEFKCPQCGVVHLIKVDVTQKQIGPVGVQELIQRLGPENAKLLDFEDKNGKIFITKKMKLPYEQFGRITGIIKDHGGRWIPQGKNSRWEI